MISDKVNAIIDYSQAGSKFVFGDQLGGGQPAVFAFQVLPIIIFICSLFAILYYLGVMQVLVHAMAVVMQRVMGASGAESTNVAASIFMGQTEAPLTIRPFLAGLTESELFTVMMSGMAHVSGAVMAAYVLMAHVEIRHLLTAVIMTAPATIMLAKSPDARSGQAGHRGSRQGDGGKARRQHHRCGGARRGRRVASGVEHRGHADRVYRADRDGATAFWAIFIRRWNRFSEMCFRPIAWLLGVNFHDCRTIGNLLGTRLVLNEFIAFQQLGPMRPNLDPRSFTIATYALCGFANFSSIAIQIGGIGALAPTRKSDLARLGLRAVAAGTMANFMSACIAGMLL